MGGGGGGPRSRRATIDRGHGRFDPPSGSNTSRISTSGSISITICVVADSCVDQTAQIAVDALAGHQHGIVIETDVQSAGAARALGSATTIARHDHPSRLWYANTDADTVVPSDWLRRHLRHAATGAGCVAGVVNLSRMDRRLRRAFHHSYRQGIGRHTHRHVHGANLGIRADVLLRIGNWPSVVSGEDQFLWDRAGAFGVARRADPRLVVETDGRLTGRAPDGFAADLARIPHRRTDPRAG